MMSTLPQTIVMRTAMTVVGILWALAGPVMAQDKFLPEGVGDLSNAKVIEVRDSKDASVLCGQLTLQPDKNGDEIEREADLLTCGGASKATGEAEIEVKKTAKGVEQEVEVEVTNLLPDTTYTIHIDSKLAGTFKTDATGHAEVELKTARPKAKSVETGQ